MLMLIYFNYIIISNVTKSSGRNSISNSYQKYLNYFFLIKDNLFNNLIFIFFFIR